MFALLCARRAPPEDIICEGVVVHGGSQMIRVDMVAYPDGARDRPVALGRSLFAVHKISGLDSLFAAMTSTPWTRFLFDFTSRYRGR